MNGEIDKNYFCNLTADGERCIGGGEGCDIDNCACRHRKWPTPEQFEDEYGEEYPDDWAVYANLYGVYEIGEYEDYKVYKQCNCSVVCACTPWGKPPNDWRPE